MGLVDGMLLAPLVGGQKAELASLEGCLKGMIPSQVAAVVDKWMGETPERWHEQMNVLGLSALLAACQKR